MYSGRSITWISWLCAGVLGWVNLQDTGQKRCSGSGRSSQSPKGVAQSHLLCTTIVIVQLDSMIVAHEYDYVGRGIPNPWFTQTVHSYPIVHNSVSWPIEYPTKVDRLGTTSDGRVDCNSQNDLSTLFCFVGCTLFLPPIHRLVIAFDQSNHRPYTLLWPFGVPAPCSTTLLKFRSWHNGCHTIEKRIQRGGRMPSHVASWAVGTGSSIGTHPKLILRTYTS